MLVPHRRARRPPIPSRGTRSGCIDHALSRTAARSLVTRQIPGRPLAHPHWRWTPGVVVRRRRATSSRAPSERGRLGEDARSAHVWRRWGPYLAERQWGTVREDYSAEGNAWNHFPHDMASWRSYRWGEDGIAGLSDNRQRLCLALALWNGRDPILKERLFGLANEEGNHGEDVKELYWYLDATPTHSYLKFLYKYPQSAFPYSLLRVRSARYGPLRRGSLLRHSRRICQGNTRRPPDASHRHQSWPGPGGAAPAATALVP